jgi:hypothetical protein
MKLFEICSFCYLLQRGNEVVAAVYGNGRELPLVFTLALDLREWPASLHLENPILIRLCGLKTNLDVIARRNDLNLLRNRTRDQTNHFTKLKL